MAGVVAQCDITISLLGISAIEIILSVCLLGQMSQVSVSRSHTLKQFEITNPPNYLTQLLKFSDAHHKKYET